MKKKQHKDKRDFREPRDSTSPTAKVNMAKVGNKKRKNKRDISEIMYYNCNKEGHYSDKSAEPRRLKN